MRGNATTVLWVVSGLLALTFVVTGVSKVASVPPSPENFARWGFSPAFMMGVGAVEIVGAIGLLVPRIAPYAATVLLLTMGGALRTGLVHHESLHIALPIALGALLAYVIYARRGVLLARLPSTKVRQGQ
ncbi:MAG TPA: DoxX family protein [Polyangiaceae bacterium]|jgi:uncharacterized membrane protein YphA (DoxX/SURF4 family)